MSARSSCRIQVQVQRFSAKTKDHVTLNGKVFRPMINKKTVSDPSKPLLLFVHQWSKMGGAGTLMEGMSYIMTSKHEYTSVTFDMRGAGKSSGSSTWSGSSEINDIVCIAEWLKLNLAQPIVIVGSSAGAPIAGSALGHADCPYIIGGVFIGYPFGFWSSMVFGLHYNAIIASHKPKFFVMGDSDGFTSVSQLKTVIQRCQGGINECYIHGGGIGHFGLESPEFDGMICDLIHNFVDKVCVSAHLNEWRAKLAPNQHIENEENKCYQEENVDANDADIEADDDEQEHGHDNESDVAIQTTQKQTQKPQETSSR